MGSLLRWALCMRAIATPVQRRGVIDMAWQISANYYEACNCDLGCPCNMSGFPTHGNCDGVVAFEITRGEREGVNLAL
jgi:hypothetical protein